MYRSVENLHKDATKTYLFKALCYCDHCFLRNEHKMLLGHSEQLDVLIYIWTHLISQFSLLTTVRIMPRLSSQKMVTSETRSLVFPDDQSRSIRDYISPL